MIMLTEPWMKVQDFWYRNAFGLVVLRPPDTVAPPIMAM
jgi:hypothetical protein